MAAALPGPGLAALGRAGLRGRGQRAEGARSLRRRRRRPGGRSGAGMAARGRRAWLSVLLGLVLGFVLASRLVLPRASELKRAGPRRRASLEGCRPAQAAAAAAQASGARSEARGAHLWQHDPVPDGGPRDRNFLFVGVMTAQKYLQTRAVAAYR